MFVSTLFAAWRFGMRALTWHGKNDIRCDTVPDPKVEHGRDAIIKVTACAICGSDLHLFDGVIVKINCLLEQIGAQVVQLAPFRQPLERAEPTSRFWRH